MSNTCGNCDCADRSQCKKQGSSYVADIVEPEKSFISTVVMEVPAAEHAASASASAAATALV